MNKDNLLYIKKSYTNELISNIRYQYYNIFNNIFNNLPIKKQFRKFQLDLKNIVNSNIIGTNAGMFSK